MITLSYLIIFFMMSWIPLFQEGLEQPILLASSKLQPRLSKSLKTQKKLKEITYQKLVNITKITDFWCKTLDVSRTQGVCQLIHIFFGSSLGQVQPCKVSSLQAMCGRFQEGAFFTPPPPPSLSSLINTLPEQSYGVIMEVSQSGQVNWLAQVRFYVLSYKNMCLYEK